MTTLKPCPLCGSAVEWEYRDYDDSSDTGDDGSGVIYCWKCNLSLFDGDYDSALAKWNRRTPVVEKKNERP